MRSELVLSAEKVLHCHCTVLRGNAPSLVWICRTLMDENGFEYKICLSSAGLMVLKVLKNTRKGARPYHPLILCVFGVLL